MQLSLFAPTYTTEDIANLEGVLAQLVDDKQICANCKICPSDGQLYCSHCVESILDFLYLAELERSAVEAEYQMQFSL